MDQNTALAVFLAEVGTAFTRLADSIQAAPAEAAAPIKLDAKPAPQEPVTQAQEPVTQAQLAEAPATMTVDAFTSECRAVLQRHGGDQAPLQGVLAMHGVKKPAQELSPNQYAPFLTDLKTAYGEH